MRPISSQSNTVAASLFWVEIYFLSTTYGASVYNQLGCFQGGPAMHLMMGAAPYYNTDTASLHCSSTLNDWPPISWGGAPSSFCSNFLEAHLFALVYIEIK